MRILSLLLAALMLLSLAACVKNPDPAETTDPAEATAATDPAETDDPALRDNLPAETFNGEEILIWLGHNEYSASFNPDPDSKGDVVAEATNKRNSAVEDRFDVTLKWITGENGETASARYTAMQSSILAGDRIDLVNHISTTLTPRMLAGCFINVANNEILDYDKPWYFDYVMENLRIHDRQYGTASWFDFNTIDRCSIVFFNMDMAKDYNVGDLYQMVYDGTWTYDKLMEICEAVGEDVNNDGIYDDNDVYGMAGEQDSWFQQVYTTGYTFVTQKEDGSLVVSEMDDRLIGAFETVRKIFKSNWYQSYYTYGEERRPAVEMYENFNNDRILFIMKKLGSTSAELLRDGGKFGLLPTPKFTEDMEYGSATLPAITCMPVTVGNARTSSIILEAMAAEAYKIMRPEGERQQHQLVMYEEGAEFNPEDPLNPDHYSRNTCLPGTNLIIDDNGDILFPIGVPAAKCCEITGTDVNEHFPSAPHVLRNMIVMRGVWNGRLYWIGNITDHKINGMNPRWPLCIVEVDETYGLAKKETFTIIDTKRDGESDRVQLSNFGLLQDRETGKLEIRLAKLCQFNGQPGFKSESWLYKITLPE